MWEPVLFPMMIVVRLRLYIVNFSTFDSTTFKSCGHIFPFGGEKLQTCTQWWLQGGWGWGVVNDQNALA
jgi:hypothetical protein